MPTNFPTGSDVFNVPNSPGSTALSASGSASRNHVQHHRDLGDTIEAMEAESTRLVHSHDGATARHGNKLLQANTHQSPDTDSAAGSLHHTLGHLANQAAPGNHASLLAFQDTHANSVSWPVGCIYISTSASNPSGSLGGTWVQIQDAFLIGVGGSYTYTGSVVANSSSHNHTVGNTNTVGAHTHTVTSPTDVQGVHGHNSTGSSGGTTVPHSHVSSNSGYTTNSGLGVDDPLGGSGTDGSTSHSHSMSSGSNDSAHAHTIGVYGNDSGHSHTISGATDSQGGHDHTVSSSSVAHLPTWKAFYMWRRTA